jgi:hypothetical protein
MGIINRKPKKTTNETREIAVIKNEAYPMENITERDLPAIISGHIEKLNELEKKVKEANRKAVKATKSADSVRNKSTGFFHQKDTMESIQESNYELAQAVMSGAGAQKISFEVQTKLAEITKYLLALGVSSIALNRSTIRQLKLIMEGSSRQKLSEITRKELLNVVKQLHDQQDMLKKQENIEHGLKQQNSSIEENKHKINATERKAKANYRKINELSNTIDQQNKNISEIELAYFKLKKIIFIGFFIVCGSLILSIISLVFSLIK